MNKERLLNVARALRESPKPDQFDMTRYSICGTPACALGHYAFREDLQDFFRLRTFVALKVRRPGVEDYFEATDVDYFDDECLEHFDIDMSQADALFSAVGCGRARTANEAAEFIEQFVANGGEVPDLDLEEEDL